MSKRMSHSYLSMRGDGAGGIVPRMLENRAQPSTSLHTHTHILRVTRVSGAAFLPTNTVLCEMRKILDV